MILTVTLNPMLDKTVSVRNVTIGRVTRAERVEMIVGGKGVNVSRQLCHLGVPNTATGFLGGEIGAMLERLMAAEGLTHKFVHVAGMTREGVTYRHTDGTMTSVFEPPHQVTSEDVRALLDRCATLTHRGDWVVCCGSSPCPEADGAYAAAILAARERGVRTALDSYGEAFREAAAVPPDLVKLNRDEYEQTHGERLSTETEFVRALEKLLATGVQFAIITDGPRALYGAAAGSLWRVLPPPVTMVNATGSGDSMLAAVLRGLESGWPPERCLAEGAAAGAANARRWEVASSSPQEIDSLAAHAVLQRL